jgi:coenzyme PQQ synthesis protein D (PqqD)
MPDQTPDAGHLVRRRTGNREFVTRRIADETLIVPVAGGVGDLEAIYSLNEVGARIWQLIDRPIRVDDIVEAIRREFDVSMSEAERDVLEFLDSLESAGLIESAAGPDG